MILLYSGIDVKPFYQYILLLFYKNLFFAAKTA